jgi:hypothetical protein
MSIPNEARVAAQRAVAKYETTTPGVYLASEEAK